MLRQPHNERVSLCSSRAYTGQDMRDIWRMSPKKVLSIEISHRRATFKLVGIRVVKAVGITPLLCVSLSAAFPKDWMPLPPPELHVIGCLRSAHGVTCCSLAPTLSSSRPGKLYLHCYSGPYTSILAQRTPGVREPLARAQRHTSAQSPSSVTTPMPHLA